MNPSALSFDRYFFHYHRWWKWHTKRCPEGEKKKEKWKGGGKRGKEGMRRLPVPLPPFPVGQYRPCLGGERKGRRFQKKGAAAVHLSLQAAWPYQQGKRKLLRKKKGKGKKGVWRRAVRPLSFINFPFSMILSLSRPYAVKRKKKKRSEKKKRFHDFRITSVAFLAPNDLRGRKGKKGSRGEK